MSSNLTVLHQYAISLRRVASEMLHSVFGREFFPSMAVSPISLRFPPGDVLRLLELRSSHSCLPPSPPSILAILREMSHFQFGIPAHSVPRFAAWETHHCSPVPPNGPGRARESATGTPRSNRCNKVSMSVIPVLGGGVGFVQSQ